MTLDFAFLIGLTALAVVALSFKRRVTRAEGVLLTLSYVTYISILVIRAT
jgi:Ca2+/Na+ antiporter